MKFSVVSTLAALFAGISTVAVSGTFSPDAVAPSYEQSPSGQQIESLPGTQPAGQAQVPLHRSYVVPIEMKPSTAPETQQVQSEVELPQIPQINIPANN